ncbi:MAG: adenosine deaminase [Cyanobacteria bacterium 13_1_40CM_2_61_4]|nr:MAG: adenosine deaminase [Cyanobacteria bacterium 13_1_40CM_2_61_4]
MHLHQPLDTDLEGRLSRLPKAELHLHFEGAFRWSTIRELHPRGTELPEREPWLERARPFADFQDFQQVFRDYIKPATGTPEAIERHAFEMTADLAKQNVRYVEVLLSHKFHTMLGLTTEQVWHAAVAGCQRATARFDIDVRWFLGISRDQPPAQALQALEEVAAFALPRGWISGIDLQGDERRGENRAFVDLYRRAAALDLKLRAHAGEICGAQNVRDAVFLCGVQDISHGVRAIEDAALVRELARTGMFLHVCPTSNVLLEVSLRALCDAGVRCTVNSDDPLPFGTDITGEYRVLLREMGFSLREVGEFAKNAFAASLLDPVKRATLCTEVDRALQ